MVLCLRRSDDAHRDAPMSHGVVSHTMPPHRAAALGDQRLSQKARCSRGDIVGSALQATATAG
eukprot:1376942-Prymnesium_polylepis.2